MDRVDERERAAGYPPDKLLSFSNILPEDEAFVARPSHLARAVRAAQAAKQRGARELAQRSRDLFGGVEAAVPASAGRRRHRDERRACVELDGGGDGQRHRRRDAQPAAELERADELAGDSLVGGGGERLVDARDEHRQRPDLNEPPLAARAEHLSRSGRAGARRT